jgi:acyl-CoA thioesterase FadM
MLATASRRVAMHDVDAAGILYFAAPYEWHEGMWTGVLADRGYPLSEQLASGYGGPTVASSATYLAPVSLDTKLSCRLFTSHVGARSFGMQMDAALANGTIAVSVTTRHVWCAFSEGTLQAVPLPDWLRELLGAG